MAEQFRDVEFTEDTELKVYGQEHNFKSGKKYSLPESFAMKVVSRWDLGEVVSDSYEVGDEEVQGRVGEEVGTADSLSDMKYRELQSLASEHDVKATGKKSELVERLEEAGVEP